MNKKELIESLKVRGFEDKIINAFSNVKRENFIPNKLKNFAYNDEALPIGEGQTISQPSTIAVMLSMLDLNKGDKVLEVGSGSGYVLALLSEIVSYKGKDKGKVLGVERIKKLVDKSKNPLKEYHALVFNKNGFFGLREKAKFDRILISAACNEIPKSLISQLKDNGIIVAPVGNKFQQSLISYKKIENRLVLHEENPGFIFVPFIQKNDKVV
jgi:protein-L-isoaspartate(D-aspartate) O-methyltransferase